MRRILCLPLLLATLTFTGCPQYDAVRKMSAEQLRVQAELGKNQQAYFAAIDTLLDKQVQVAFLRLDAITKEEIKTLNDQLVANLAADPVVANHPALITANSKEVAAKAAETQDIKQQITAHVKVIKDKHQEIVQAYAEMYKAQQELDRYIQLKKVDEVIAEQVMGAFKINQDKVTSALDTAAKSSTAIMTLLGAK